MSKNLIYTDRVDLYSLWRKALFQDTPNIPLQQIKLLTQLLSPTFNQKPINKIIDLGGGIGTHALPLSAIGYDITVLDISKKALELLNKKAPNLPTIEADFSQIKVQEIFDAAICMWSTINYLHTEDVQKHFFGWLIKHTKNLIIIDQANFLTYQKDHLSHYQASDKNGKIEIERCWTFENQIRKTNYTYYFTNLKGETQTLHDTEEQYFFTLEEMEKRIGKRWKLRTVLGNYQINSTFEENSTRLITVFEKK